MIVLMCELTRTLLVLWPFRAAGAKVIGAGEVL
jgi:hypothetical protein